MNALPDETISAVGFAYCKSCGMLWSAWAHAEMDRLKQELATLKYTIVTTIGGVDYEGFPTSEINYLQRLRILLEKEQELATERERLAEAEKVIDLVIENRAAMILNIPCAYQYQEVLKTYRAKYPIPSENK
jgi:hypothetical protein